MSKNAGTSPPPVTEGLDTHMKGRPVIVADVLTLPVLATGQ
ncbi:hypothetical protein [Streptomyces resistomycificus]|nr:hypothetical protein [Streptomyces resistomycificus]